MSNIFERAQVLLRRRSHYREVFRTVSGQAVLADLRRFCRYGESPLVVSTVRQESDQFATAVNIGRQEAFARIAHMIHLDDAQLINLKEEAEHE